MRRIAIVLSFIILVQLLGCSSPPRQTIVVIAEGRAVGHTALKPDLSGFEPAYAADAVVRAEYHLHIQ